MPGVCGIGGIVRFPEDLSLGDLAAARAMVTAQRHRGPDGEGLLHDRHVALGHRRLAILDPSAAAAQPMKSPDGRVWLSYNGEIYNFAELRSELARAGHCFSSRSDTEVLVHGYEQWGIDGLLGRLRGMFAFALYDRGSECGQAGGVPGPPVLYLARDTLGIKPLYYARLAEGGLAFASETRALTASGITPATVDREGLLGFLSLGSVPAPATLFAGVRCLPPGHYLAAGRDGAPRSYPLPECWSAAGLRTALEESVAAHLASDVPLGVFLSGGVDSTALATLAGRAGQVDLRTLTVALPGSDLDESARAAQTARRLGTTHQQVPIAREQLDEALQGFLAAVDQPTHDGLNTYLVARAAAQAGLRVVLSGLGADELFLGYRHLRLRAPLALAGAPRPLRRLVALAARGYRALSRQDRWGRWDHLADPGGPGGVYAALRGAFAPEQVARLTGAGRAEVASVVADRLGDPAAAAAAHPLELAIPQRLEVSRYLHDQLLRDADVFGMAHSVEIRVPYLDLAVVSAAAALPRSAHLRRGLNKPALVQALGDPAVAALARLPKRGFTLPVEDLLRNRGAAVLEPAGRSGVLDPAAVAATWLGFQAGRTHWSRVWALVVLGAVLDRCRQ